MLLHRLASLTLVVTFVLLLAGGLVHSTGSGLACPDWPLCHGKVFPPMVGGIKFEHSHRLIASAVAMLTALTCVALWRCGDRPYRKLAAGLIIALAVQITLGAITVIFHLPMLVSTAHLALALLFYSTLVALSVQTSARGTPGPAGTADGCAADLAPYRSYMLIATIIIYAQMILGALMRHTGTGLACPAFPLCDTGWLPVNGPQSIHFLHRVGAVAATAAVVWMWVKLRGAAKSDPELNLYRWAALLATTAQFALGVAAVLTEMRLNTVMAHMGVGIALLTAMVAMTARCWLAERA